jgi:four helix bundle protein
MQNFRKLKVWEKAHSLAVAVHALTEEMPRKSNTELIDQLRRAALSVPAKHRRRRGERHGQGVWALSKDRVRVRE